MRIYFLIKKEENIKKPDDITVEMVYGIYNSKYKSFWECKIVNEKLKDNKYIIKEINLEENLIVNTYKLYDDNNIIDKKDYKYKIKSY